MASKNAASGAGSNAPAAEATQQEQTGKNKYRDGRWSVPSKRAKGYAAERADGRHRVGPKLGKQLTDYEAGIRSGYLQCQNDHAGHWKYRQALELGYGKKEAGEMSKKPWDKNTPPKKKKGA